MPEQDFELYLSLLSRFLRLNPAQRDEIADELRDHLEQRLEALAARGVPRDEAIRLALDEFGNAAELAEHFTKAAHIRRRRLIMRCTFGTVGALAASLLVAMAFWPATPQSPMAAKAVAETEKPADIADAAPVGAPARGVMRYLRSFGQAERRILGALENPTEVKFNQMPLEEGLHYLGEFHNFNVWIDKVALAEEGIASDSLMTLELKGVSLRSVLKLLLDPLQLTYVIEDEVMKITTYKNTGNVIGVYDVRDLLEREVAEQPVQRGGRGGAAGGVMMGSDSETARNAVRGHFLRKQPLIHESSSLAEVVAHTIAPKTWTDAGGTGSAIQYNGVLVVRNSQTVNDQVTDFLKLLRIAREGAPARGR